MNQHVSLEMSSMFGGVITMSASKRLSTVNHHMTFQIAYLIACVVALVATVGLYSNIHRFLGKFGKIVLLHIYINICVVLCKVEGKLITILLSD